MKNMNKKVGTYLIAATLTALAIGLTGCHSSDDSYTYSDPYYRAWYDVYGNHCNTGYPMAGCNFYFNGDQIIDTEDPYFSNSSYHLEYGWWEYYDTYGYPRDYLGWAWLSDSGILYDDYGRALNEEDAAGDRDILALVAEQEKQNVESAGKEYAARYGLAEDVGIRVAKTLNDWALIGKGRARTEQDIKDFSKRLGVDLNSAVVALEKAEAGDTTELKNTVTDMAKSWGTSPETMKEILKNTYKNELPEFSLD